MHDEEEKKKVYLGCRKMHNGKRRVKLGCKVRLGGCMAGYFNKLALTDLQGEFQDVNRVIYGKTGCI